MKALVDGDLERDKKGRYTSGQRKVNQFGWTLLFTDTHKECRKCNKVKVHADFHRDSSNKYGLAYWCKECACASGRKHHSRRMKEDASYREAMKTRFKKRKYGLTQEEYVEKLIAQGCKCAICGVELPTEGSFTHLDHSHTTGKIRAFLCTNCNRGLGHFKESVDFLMTAVQYLRQHNSNVDTVKEEVR